MDTKQKIIAAASDLFHAKGVHATGVEEILQKAGAGKSQFYHHFENKDDLVHEVLQRFFDHMKADNISGKGRIKSWKELERWLQNIVELQRSTDCKRSCPIGTIGSEIRADQKILRKDVCEILDYLRSAVVDFFHSLKDKGQVSKSCNPESVADFCMVIIQGGSLVSKIYRDTNQLENAIKHALKYMKSLRRYETS